MTKSPVSHHARPGPVVLANLLQMVGLLMQVHQINSVVLVPPLLLQLYGPLGFIVFKLVLPYAPGEENLPKITSSTAKAAPFFF